MFVEENDEHSLLWSGPRCGSSTVKTHFGLDHSYSFADVPHYLRQLSSQQKNQSIYIDNHGENSCIGASLLPSGMKISPVLDKLRVIKSAAELHQMEAGCKLSAAAFVSTIRSSKESTSESLLAARMEFECKQRGATGLSYIPVIASGDRANIIHYTRNDLPLKEGELVLMDAGGKFGPFCTDITRTIPHSSFTSAQRELYNAVLRAQRVCIEAVSEFKNFKELSLETLNGLAMLQLVQELSHLGFKSPEDAVNKLFPHSIGHYLGMDLHDTPSISYSQPLVPGMVITIEPGLYIPYDSDYPSRFHGIGIRIEDDIAITQDGMKNLTESVPRDPEELEHLINQ